MLHHQTLQPSQGAWRGCFYPLFYSLFVALFRWYTRYTWAPSASQRNKLARLIHGNGSRSGGKGKGKSKAQRSEGKGAYSSTYAPTPLVVAENDFSFPNPDDADDRALLQEIQDAMLMEARIRKMPTLVADEWNPSHALPHSQWRGGFGPKRRRRQRHPRSGVCSPALHHAHYAALGLASYFHEQVDCSVLVREGGDDPANPRHQMVRATWVYQSSASSGPRLRGFHHTAYATDGM